MQDVMKTHMSTLISVKTEMATRCCCHFSPLFGHSALLTKWRARAHTQRSEPAGV